MTPAQEAAALWGSAQNRAYSELQRLRMALAALEFYGGLAERVEELAEEWEKHEADLDLPAPRRMMWGRIVAKLRATLDPEEQR